MAAGVLYVAAGVFVLGMATSAWAGVLLAGMVVAVLTFAWFTK